MNGLSRSKVATAANPEDAAAKLAIELFKHGILHVAVMKPERSPERRELDWQALIETALTAPGHMGDTYDSPMHRLALRSSYWCPPKAFD